MPQPAFADSGLRALFDAVIDLAPRERDARIAGLGLPDAVAVRLRAMVAFDAIVDLPAAARVAQLAALELAPEVRAAVEAMLGANAQPPSLADGFALDAIDRISGGDEERLGASLVGTCIGSFRLLALIGHGGSSVVFRAERAAGDGAQVVALKLLRTGLYSADAQRRFRREQAILAQLTHPNIATLIEGGVSSAGIPYIAMEFVDGVPITQAADAQALNLEQRLAWFAHLCRTVEAAHAALIVHRDLKPSNLLVTADGTLKVVDFGIAKLLDDEPFDTRTQSIVLTPEYAAPEQFGSAALTTAVDVYALGIVLGELLTGRRLGAGQRPTSVLAAGRDGSPLPIGLPARDVLARKLRGDVDAIVACALADDSALRYPSAGAFADDVERCLAGKPVRAHPPSRTYRVKKFIGRHRGAVAATAVLLVALLATLGVVIGQARSIAREAQRAQSTRDFLLRVFSAAEPAGPRLAPPTVADVVRASIDEAQHAASLAPQVRVELIDALGAVLRKQGDLKGSLELLERNYRDALAALGADDPAVLQAGLGLAQARSENGLHAAARPLLDALIARAVADDAGADLRARLLAASANLGTERFERERALDESARAVALCRTDCSERTRIRALVTRGYVLSNFQDDAAAIPVLEQALAEQERLFGAAHVEVADTLQALSRAYRRLGKLERAQALARRSIGIVEASLPDPHQRRADALDTLRHVLIDARELDEAVALGQRIIAIDEVARGPGHPSLATDQNTLGFTYMLQQDFVHAGEHFRAALAIADALGDERRSAIYQADLGYALGLSGDAAAGLPKIQAAIARFRAQKEVDYSEVTSALEKLGDLQRRGGALAEAEATFAEADRLYRERLPGAPGEWHARTLVGLGRVLSASGDRDGARRTLADALALFSTPELRLSILRVEARAALADLLARSGATDEALRLLDLARGEAARARGYLPDDVRELLRSAGAAAAARG